MRKGDRLGDAGRLAAFVVLFLILAGLFLSSGSESVLVQGAGTLVAVVLATGVFMRFEGDGLGAVGLAPGGAGRELILGMGLGVVVALPALLLALGPGGMRWSSADGSALEYASTGLWTLAILTVPAAAEEILFRGYPMRILLRGWGTVVALTVTSVAFAALHGWNPSVAPLALANIALAGVLLGVVYLKTGSLWWATGVHAGWNFGTAFLADLPLSGIRLVDSPMLDVASQGWPLVTGGPFGLEGGLAATAALAVGTGVVWRAPILTPSPTALARGSRAPLSPPDGLVLTFESQTVLGDERTAPTAEADHDPGARSDDN